MLRRREMPKIMVRLPHEVKDWIKEQADRNERRSSDLQVPYISTAEGLCFSLPAIAKGFKRIRFVRDKLGRKQGLLRALNLGLFFRLPICTLMVDSEGIIRKIRRLNKLHMCNLRLTICCARKDLPLFQMKTSLLSSPPRSS